MFNSKKRNENMIKLWKKINDKYGDVLHISQYEVGALGGEFKILTEDSMKKITIKNKKTSHCDDKTFEIVTNFPTSLNEGYHDFIPNLNINEVINLIEEMKGVSDVTY